MKSVFSQAVERNKLKRENTHNKNTFGNEALKKEGEEERERKRPKLLYRKQETNGKNEN